MSEERSRARLQIAVGEDYRVGRLIGAGGFAQVFEAEDVRLGRTVAIKVVRPDLPVSEEVLERFLREARSVAGLRHPNVMEIYTVGEAEGVAYFVMPLVRGDSLRERIERAGALPLDEVDRVLLQTASALEAAHRAGTIHRDVKPDNILLEADSERVLITDFGIAKALEDEATGLTTAGTFVGTPRYMSPEQATGDPLDHRSDVYSLGVVAFEMITGQPPFDARTTPALVAKHLTEPPPGIAGLRPECPDRLAHVVERCLAKDPGDRWASLDVMIRVLGGSEGADPKTDAATLEPPRPGVRELPGVESDPPSALRRVAAGVGVAVLVLIALDVALGLGGVSAVGGVAGAVYLAARAARLWTAGYDWREILRESPADGEAGTGDAHGEGAAAFGRFGSVVRACVADRAAILNAYTHLPRQEQARFPLLRERVEELAVHTKHLARKIVTVEARMAQTAAEDSSTTRHAARMEELGAAREAAAVEMRVALSRMEGIRDALTVDARIDARRAAAELERALTEVGSFVERRSG